MANVDAPSGFTAVRQNTGGVLRQEEYTIADNYSTTLYNGAPVMLSGTGKNVILSTAGSDIVGTLRGVRYTKSNGEIAFDRKWTGDDVLSGSTPVAYVDADPMTVFVAQIDGAFVEADVGKTYDHTLASGGSDATGMSTCELDYSTGVAEGNVAPGQFQTIGLAPIPGNEYGANAKVECVPVLHSRLNAGTR